MELWTGKTMGSTYTVSNVLYFKHNESNQMLISKDSDTGPWTLVSYVTPTSFYFSVSITNKNSESAIFYYVLNNGSYEFHGVE